MEQSWLTIVRHSVPYEREGVISYHSNEHLSATIELNHITYLTTEQSNGTGDLASRKWRAGRQPKNSIRELSELKRSQEWKSFPNRTAHNHRQLPRAKKIARRINAARTQRFPCEQPIFFIPLHTMKFRKLDCFTNDCNEALVNISAELDPSEIILSEE